MWHMARRHVLAILDCQTLHEHAPGLLGLVALDATRLGRTVHLKCHEPSIHLVEQPLADRKDDIWPVHGVFDREDQRCAILGDTQMPVPVSFGGKGKKTTDLQDL